MQEHTYTLRAHSQRAEEMAQFAKCLLPKEENLSLDPQHQGPGMVALGCISSSVDGVGEEEWR